MRRLAFAAAALLVAVLVLAQGVEVIVTYLFTLSPQTSALTVRYPMPLPPVTDAQRVLLSSAFVRQLRSTAVMYGVNLLTGFYHYSVTEYPPPVNLVLPRISSVTASTGAITLMYTIPVNATIQPPPPSQPPEEQQPPGDQHPEQPGQPPEEQPPSQPPEEQPPGEPGQPGQPPGEQSPGEEPSEEEGGGPVGFGEVVYHGLSGPLPYIVVALLLVFVAALTVVGVRRTRRTVIVIEGPRLGTKK
ncbi:MAG: hypothetical protein QXT28_09695 [Thermofilaceae archaeon]